MNRECSICHNILEIVRSEMSPHDGHVEHFCNNCFWPNSEQCEICDDHFVHIGWHNFENRSKGALLV